MKVNYKLIMLFFLLSLSGQEVLGQSLPGWTQVIKPDTTQTADTLSLAERIFAEEAGAILGLSKPQIMGTIEAVGGIAGLIGKLMQNDDHKAIAQINAVEKKRKLFEKYRKRLDKEKITPTEYRYLIRSLMEIITNK